MKNELIKSLGDLPGKIKVQELEVLRLSNELSETELVFDLKKIEIVQEISNAVTSGGKSVFSNSEKREAELVVRVNSREDCRNLKEAIKKLRYALDCGKVELRFLLNRFKADIVLVKLLEVE